MASFKHAIAESKGEIARGLTVAITNQYYASIVVQREYATAQQVLDRQRFLIISKELEHGGERAHRT